MGDGRSPSCLSKLKHTCYRHWNEEKRHTRVSDQYVKWDEDFFEKVFLEVKWRMVIRKVSPKKGVALLLSINVG